MSDLFDELAWSTIRATAIEKFNGELPGPDAEAPIIAVFELAPQTVVRSIDEVATKLQAGEIRSGWAILRARLEGAGEPVRDVTVKGPNLRAKKISQAEQWLRTCGIHFDRESELEDELFGDRGLLRPWADDIALRGQMLTAWRELRPRGEQLEQDTDERAEHWKQTTGKMRAETIAARSQAQRTTTIERALGETLASYAPEPDLAPSSQDEPALEPAGTPDA